MNPLVQAIGGTAPGMVGISPQMLQQARQMIASVKMVMNPQQAETQLRKMCGEISPQEIFNQQCREHGLDPDRAMGQIRQILS